jgi:hypothetical protein
MSKPALSLTKFAARGYSTPVWVKELQPSGRRWGWSINVSAASLAGKKRFVPGKVQMVRVGSIPELWICSMAGQNLHGSKKRYTDYDALALCLFKLHHKSLELELTPFLPYKLGWSGGRGEWSVVRPLIEQHCPNAVICID